VRYLLDSHTLVFALTAPSKLGREARRVLESSESDILVSTVTFWELSLKFGLGKLSLSGMDPEGFPEACRNAGFETIDLDADDGATFHKLSRVGHRDPFDRMLVWQAIRRKLALISVDRQLAAYEPLGLRQIW
jgi:PIN domain nuclease of toxin-antitoxin system